MRELYTTQVRVQHRRIIPVDSPGCIGHTSEALPDTLETVTIYADLEAIARTLGVKAAQSKSGKSKEISGLLVVKHHRGK
jgi:hypothetical protein